MATPSVTHTLVNGTIADADHVNQNFVDLITFLDNEVIHRDGSRDFTAVVAGVSPTNVAHLATKGYVDTQDHPQDHAARHTAGGGDTLPAGSIAATQLAVDAVETAKIKDAAVTAGKIASGAVGTTQLAADAVTAAKIAAGAVGTSELAASAVTSAKIGDGQVTHIKLANDYIRADANDTFTGAIRGPDGTVGAPTFAFAGATDWGMFRDVDFVRIVKNGATSTAFGNPGVNPGANNARDLGSTALRWRDIFLINQPNVSSDPAHKREIQDSPLGLDFILAMRPISWIWEDGHRPHYGIDIDVLRDWLEANGTDFGGYVDPAINPMPTQVFVDDYGNEISLNEGIRSLRVGELIGPIVRAIQELAARG